ncbi:MAG: hypothetical protein KJ556_21580 [Gammaproteobacteria bacterium]|nr:hypothetical protein [Gammaproteobacteria bacterium]
MASDIKPLNLKEALELYDILGKYLPEASKDETVLEFIGTIVDRIVEDRSGAYIEAICLMHKCTVEELQGLPSQERLIFFMDGLMKNNIINLKKFCKEIGYAR